MAIEFNGSSQYGIAASAVSEDLSVGTWTLFCWFKTPATVDSGMVLCLNRDASYGRQAGIYINGSSELGLMWDNGSESTATTGVTLSANTWYRAAYTHTSGNVNTVYVNAYANSGNVTPAPSTIALTHIEIGSNTSLGSAEYPTEVDVAYAAFWDSVLSQSDLEEILDSSVKPANCSTAPTDYWDLISDANSDAGGTNFSLTGSPTFNAEDPLAGAAIGDLIQSDRDSGGTATLTLSGAPTSGNLLIYGTVSGNSGVTLSTPPSGFTEITSHTSADYSSWWGYKVSDGSETSRSHAWSAGNGYSFYAEYYWQEGTPRVNSNEDTSNVTADGTGPQSSGSVTPHDLTTNLCLAFITSRYQPSSDGSGAFSNSYTADVSFAATPTIAGTAIASLANASGSTSSSYSWSDAGIDTYGAIAAFSPPGAGGGLLPLLNAYYS